MGSRLKIQHITKDGMVDSGIRKLQMIIIGQWLNRFAIASIGALYRGRVARGTIRMER